MLIKHNLLCFGHRGASGHEPENTLRSVRRALELGADGVEVDVHLVDEELVVIHDDTLNRTTNGRGRLDRRSLAYVRTLDAGLGERIPLLQEVLDLVNRRAVVNVELKGAQTAAAVVRLMNRCVTERGWDQNQFLISSFDFNQLHLARQISAGIPIALLANRPKRDIFEIASRLGATSIHASLRSLNAGWVQAAHREGLQVFVFTVNSPGDIATCVRLGVDGVFTDYPERVVAARSKFTPGANQD